MSGLPGPIGPPGPRGRNGEIGPAVSGYLLFHMTVNPENQIYTLTPPYLVYPLV